MRGLVVAGGVSGGSWAAWADGASVAAVNGCIRDDVLRDRADYAVCVESECMDSWIGSGIAGVWVLEAGRRFVVGRHELYARSVGEDDPTRIKGGLLQFEDVRPSRPLIGGSSVAAMHYLCAKGVTELHTVGLDLCFKGAKYWHSEEAEWRSRPGHDVVEYAGLPTLAPWAWTAVRLMEWRAVLTAHGITWIDHSEGLLQALGMPA